MKSSFFHWKLQKMDFIDDEGKKIAKIINNVIKLH